MQIFNHQINDINHTNYLCERNRKTLCKTLKIDNYIKQPNKTILSCNNQHSKSGFN